MGQPTLTQYPRLAALVVGVIVVLSTLRTITTIVPNTDIITVCLALLGALPIVLIAAAATITHQRPTADRRARQNCTIAPLEKLPPPTPSSISRLALVVLRCQPILAAVLLIAKIVQLGFSG